MNKFKGTKGEWHACCKDSKPHFLFAKETEIIICGFYQKQDDGTELPLLEVQANARLIESAPDLLEALLNIENDNGSIPLPIWEMRNKAINKALGNEQ